MARRSTFPFRLSFRLAQSCPPSRMGTRQERPSKADQEKVPVTLRLYLQQGRSDSVKGQRPASRSALSRPGKGARVILTMSYGRLPSAQTVRKLVCPSRSRFKMKLRLVPTSGRRRTGPHPADTRSYAALLHRDDVFRIQHRRRSAPPGTVVA